MDGFVMNDDVKDELLLSQKSSATVSEPLTANKMNSQNILNQSEVFSSVIREWGQSVQTGNVNGLYHYPALLDQVQDIGDQLQGLGAEMVQELAKSEKNLSLTMLAMKAQGSTDLLHRGLFERTADVGAMAENTSIKAFMEKGQLSDEDQLAMQTLLENYVYEYSVYDDVMILNPDGRPFASLKGALSPNFFGSEMVKTTLNTDGYCEFFRFTPNPVLYYMQTIFSNSGQKLGVMVLSFQFQYEMNEEIFPDVLNGDEETYLLLVTSDKRIAAASDPMFKIGAKFPVPSENIMNFNGEDYDVSVQDTNGYEGYMGFGLRGIAMKKTSAKKERKKDGPKRLANNAAVPRALKRIISNVENVETDLHIVGLNGKLQAGREDDKTLPPILDGIRDAGGKIRSKFQDVIVDLVQDTEIILKQKADAISKMGMVVVDHNLYERCNDVCWWATGGTLREALSKEVLDDADRSEMTKVLSQTNDLYTVYQHLFLFDADGVVQADSKPEWARELVGQKMTMPEISEVLRNTDPKRYFVTRFSTTPLYNDRPTYIYYATIFDPNSDKPVGGIGLVFDSEIQFKAMLEECLEGENAEREGEKAIAIFVNGFNDIISSTSDDFKPGTRFDPNSISEDDYIMHRAKSVGYREYLRTDGYKHDKSCYVILPKG